MDYLKYLGYIKWALAAVLVVALVYVWMPSPPPVVQASKALDAPIKREAEHVEAVKTRAKQSLAVVATARKAATEAGRIYHALSGKAQVAIDNALTAKAVNSAPVIPAMSSLPVLGARGKAGIQVFPPTAVYVETLEDLAEAQDAHITNLDAVVQAEDVKDELLTAQNAQLKGEETQLQKDVKTEERKVFWAKVAVVVVLIAVGAHFLIPGAL